MANLAYNILTLYNSELRESLPNKEQIKKRLEKAKEDHVREEIEFLETVLKYMEE